MNIGIVTDSTCDLPPDVIVDYGIETLPLRENNYQKPKTTSKK